MEGLVNAMMANTKARRKRKEEEMKKAGLKEVDTKNIEMKFKKILDF